MTETITQGRIIAHQRIRRADLKNNPNDLFVFGDNLKRQGFGGQAWAMRGEPNAVGIPTKRLPSNRERAFFADEDIFEVKPIIDAEFDRLRAALAEGRTVHLPAAGIGTGLAQLDARAPRIFLYIQEQIASLGPVENES